MIKKVITVLLVVFLVGCAAPVDDGEELKIGLLATLSGPAAVHGEHVVMGAEKAVAELNEEGKNVVLVVEDNKNDPKTAIDGYRKILLKEPDVIFTTMSGASSAIIPLAEREGIPVVTSLTYADFREYDNVYQYFQTTEYLTEMAADFFIEEEVSKVGLLSSNIEAGHALMKMAEKVFVMKGLEVVAVEYYDPSQVDQRTEVLKVAEKSPDAIYVFDLRPDQIVTQIKAHYEGMIVFTDTPVATNLYKLKEMDGTYAAAQKYMISGTGENRKSDTLFEGKKANAEAGMGYDVVYLLAEGFDIETWPHSVLKLGLFEGLAGEVDLSLSRKPEIEMRMVKIVDGMLVEE